MEKFKKSLCIILTCLMLLSVAAVAPVSVSATKSKSAKKTSSSKKKTKKKKSKKKKAKKVKYKLNKKKISIVRGNTYKLKLKKAKAKKVKWKTSKKSVATVSKGIVTAVKAGKTTITAKYKGKKYKCKVTVQPKVTTLNKSFKCYVKDTKRLVLKSKGVATAAKSWASSNSNIATINSNGVITGKTPGSVTITATKNNGDMLKVKVNVLNPYAALKDYINKNGKTNADGNQYISYTSGTSVFTIIHNKSKNTFDFIAETKSASDTDKITMSINADNTGTPAVISKGTNNTYGTTIYSAQASINPASYSAGTSLSFKVEIGNAENVNKNSNSTLHKAFENWSKMLNDDLDMNMCALGFANYK